MMIFVQFFLGQDFQDARYAIAIMIFRMFFIGWTNIMGIQILIPHNRNKEFMISTTAPAIISVGLNLLFLPKLGYIGAAIVSVLTEALVWAIQLFFTRRYLKEVPIIGLFDKNHPSISYHVWSFACFKNSYSFFTNPKCSSFCSAWWNYLSFCNSIFESDRCRSKIKQSTLGKNRMHKTRNINLDLIKVLACIGVVLLHTTMIGFKETGSWNLLAYLYYLGTYSIPLFLWFNGYLLLGKSNITYSYILQKVKWILIIVSSWTTIIWLFKRDFTVNPIKKIVGSLLQKGYFSQFWFFGALILYYFMPTCFEKNLNSKRKYLYILSCLIAIGLMFELANIILQMPLQSYVIQTFRLWTWFFYYILGGW